MLCRSCLKQRDKNIMQTIVLPGEIGHDLPHVIDICSECTVVFWKYNTKILVEEVLNRVKGKVTPHGY